MVSRAVVFIDFERYDQLSSREALPTRTPHRNVVVIRRDASKTTTTAAQSRANLAVHVHRVWSVAAPVPPPPPPQHAFAATPQHWRREVERAHDAAAAVARRPAVAREESIAALPRDGLGSQPRPDAPDRWNSSPRRVASSRRRHRLRPDGDAPHALQFHGPRCVAQDICSARRRNSAVAAVVAEFGVAHKAKRRLWCPWRRPAHRAVTIWTHKGVRGRVPGRARRARRRGRPSRSKDFLTTFLQWRRRWSATIPFVASAWNDNGFAKHGDPGALRRTGWFPGSAGCCRASCGRRSPSAVARWPLGPLDAQRRGRTGKRVRLPGRNRASHESEYGTFLDLWHDKRYFKTDRAPAKPL